jgi:hypothetical protein
MLQQLQAERSRAANELERLDKAIAVFEKLVGNHAPGATRKESNNGRKLSAAARRKISKAQKARWAKLRQQAA